MLELHIFPNNKKGFNFSPFCLKAEVYLKMTKTPYVTVEESSTQKSPKGKMPFLVDGEERIGDSGLLIDYVSKKYCHNLDDWLTQEQHAMGLSVVRMLEEHFYFALLYSRWIDDKTWPAVKKVFFGNLPPVLSTLIPNLIRGSMKKAVWKQGIGRHSEEEIFTMAKDDLRAVSLILGTNKFLLGEQLSSYDASVYGFIKNLLDSNLGTELESEAKTYGNFHSYCKEIEKLY